MDCELSVEQETICRSQKQQIQYAKDRMWCTSRIDLGATTISNICQ